MTATIFGIVSLLVAAVAAWAAARQARLLRFSLQVQSLLAVEKEYDERDFRRIRHHAARQLQSNTPDLEVHEVLDFFDTLGMLVPRRALATEMVWHVFFHFTHGYWQAGRAYVEQERAANERVWEEIPSLYRRLIEIESQRGRQRPVDLGVPRVRSRTVSGKSSMIAILGTER